MPRSLPVLLAEHPHDAVASANADICRLIANALDWTSRKETT
jgi:hypothetical protein